MFVPSAIIQAPESEMPESVAATPDFRATLERLIADPSLPDLSLRQLATVLFIRSEPRQHCTIRGMAGALQVSKPAITRATDRLSDLGLVERRADPADRRSVLVRLTAKGRKFAAALPGAQVGEMSA